MSEQISLSDKLEQLLDKYEEEKGNMNAIVTMHPLSYIKLIKESVILNNMSAKMLIELKEDKKLILDDTIEVNEFQLT